MKKGTVVTGTVEGLSFPNKGILTVEDSRMVVKNTIPGQVIEAVVTKNGSNRMEGRLQRVVTPSPLETESPCPHYGVCGGCAYQTIPYEEQLKIKSEQVRQLLTPVLGEDFPFEGIEESPRQSEYRNKMEFSFGDFVKDGPMTLGMHKRGSFYDIVTVDGCRIVDEDYRQILRATLDYFTEKGIPFYRKMQRTGALRHLVVRKAVKTGEILVMLVTTSAYRADEEFVSMLQKLPLNGTYAGILQAINDLPADTVQSQETIVLYGRDHFYEELLGLRFKITPFSFFQTNSLGAEVLYSLAREYVGSVDGQLVYDLYSGTGTIAQILAPVAKKVIGVEIVEEAVEAAKINAAENGLTNCEFIAGDVLKVLDTITERPDTIILDPPRDGIHPKAIRQMVGYGVERMVYISCKPTSLARDLPAFLMAGYCVERVKCVDMFPFTSGVETVCLLRRKKNH
ncbi:23S rRNA (uracil(1939)-C(5))-methyltransferase RlmD [Lachnospiraceae bacterium CLA-AA-H215]|uniref:23S rRNA (Uracil(1939)-C(5))-methyltransferase RlmD n=1 Tax=Hominifimenecus microfluidus TaxID=2885348 RepID=A0AAE3JGC7_9FIRM|nr:23S rRNA (uracil(1939)-C(5))-methyltransferase RlmD [Hominifimenecus microfluidus]MCC2232403.1 23S rRNA (uracil(1939)-C(5))-methyltransferase RlmD [Hominifimenecus microfluidus]